MNEKEEAFTPGPWVAETDGDQWRIYAGVFPGAQRAVFDIADVWLPETGDRAANAALIAAAPALYEALKGILAMAEDLAATFPLTLSEDGSDAVSRARAALAQAEGKS